MSAQDNQDFNSSYDKLKRLQETFIAVTSHKFLSPITVVKWNIELLLADESISQKSKEKLVDIQTNIQKLDDLTKLLLRIYEVATAPSENKFMKFSMNSVLDGVLAEFKALIEQNQLAIKNNAQNLDKVEFGVSESFLREVLRGIVENAIHYNKVGGMVQIDTKLENNMLEIHVSDTGIGVPAQEKDLIFNPFYRGSNVMKLSFKGNGLRLYMSKMGLNLNGGDIRFESQEGRGSKFIVVIPVKQ